MHRTQILLENWQYDRLRQLAQERRQSLGEILRRWVTEKLAPSPAQEFERDPLLDVVGMGNHAANQKKTEMSKPIATQIDDSIYRKDW